jgi:UDP-N-acetylglucosamine--N-acetylmuramyl-(pentapeptide) pyrophosphoryl-undecaprenol N-acetylglucosamine transferase
MKIVLATGGTGGHIFPAQAVAEALLARGAEVEFIVDSRFHAYHAKAQHFPNVPIHTITASSISGTLPRKLYAAAKNAYACAQAWSLLRHIRPDIVMGFGGYPSLPTLLVAKGYIRILHEQNAILGKTNRLLASKVDAIATAFPQVQAIEQGATIQYVGNPVRASIQALHALPPQSWDGASPLHLLVTGGSQGAAIFAEIVPAAMRQLPETLLKQIHITQQVRAEQLEEVRAVYDALPLTYEIAPYFADMEARLRASHLVIARAGASTIAELQCAGLPALFVPLPHAADNHQQKNAEAMVNAGAAWMLIQRDFTANALADRLQSFFTDPHIIQQAATASHALGLPDAASSCADYLFSLLNKNDTL